MSFENMGEQKEQKEKSFMDEYRDLDPEKLKEGDIALLEENIEKAEKAAQEAETEEERKKQRKKIEYYKSMIEEIKAKGKGETLE